MEDVAARAPAVAPETLGDAREQLEALLQRVAGAGASGRTAADQLPAALKALAVKHPTPETAAYLRGLLEAGTLDGYRDSAGLSCRAAVIQAQLALGFPLALEVNPDDLAWLRARTQNEAPAGPRVVTAVLALLSMGWSGAMIGLLANTLRTWELFAALPFLLGGAHGLAALVAAAFAQPTLPIEAKQRWRSFYRLLARMGWLGPAVSLIPALMFMSGSKGGLDAAFLVWFVGLVCATPAMTTAVACSVTGKRLIPEDEDPPPSPPAPR